MTRHDDPAAAEWADWTSHHDRCDEADEHRSMAAREVREDPTAGLRSTIEDRTSEAVRYICGRLAAAEDPTHPQHQRAREELAGKRETPAWVREGGWGS